MHFLLDGDEIDYKGYSLIYEVNQFSLEVDDYLR